MTTTRRPDLIDRAWWGLWSSVMVTDVAVPPLEEVRDVVRTFARTRPELPYFSTVGAAAPRWLPVTPAGLEAYLGRVVVSCGDPEPGAIDEFLTSLTEQHPPDLPFVLWVGARTIAYTGTHMLGDAASAATILRAAIDLDPVPLVGLVRLDAVMLRSAMLTQTRRHHREWLGVASGRLRRRTSSPITAAAGASPTVAGDAGPTPVRATVPATVPAQTVPGERVTSSVRSVPGRTEIVSAVLDNAEMRRISQWRNANARGTSITAVMASLTQRALADVGVELEPTGFFTLVDLRRYLVGAPEDTFVFGNLAKSVHVACDLGDPRSVDAALASIVESARPLAATVAGLAMAAVAPPGPQSTATGAPLVLTYNSIPGLPGSTNLPWLAGPGRYFGAGFPVGGDGLSLIANKLREHMEMSASVGPDTVDPQRVRAALAGLPDATERLRPPVTGGL